MEYKINQNGDTYRLKSRLKLNTMETKKDPNGLDWTHKWTQMKTQIDTQMNPKWKPKWTHMDNHKKQIKAERETPKDTQIPK